VGRPLVTVCTEPWVNAGVTDELWTGLGVGDSPEVVPLWSEEGWLPRADAGVTNELPPGTGGGPAVTLGGEAL